MKIKLELEPQVKFGLAVKEDGFEVDFFVWKLSVKYRNYSWETTEPKKIAVAGNYVQFMDWCIRTNQSPKLFRYVCSPDHLKGLKKVDAYFIGTFEDNPIMKGEGKGWAGVGFRREIYCYE